MADSEYTGQTDVQDVDPAASSLLGGVTNVVGTLVSVGLLVGVGIWGYRLMVRDVSGVPVVRAIEGPMRVQPKVPGGRQADNQGLAVNAVAALGTAATPADRLLLSPQPVTLTDEDVPMTQIEPVEAAQAAPKPVDSEAVTAFRQGSVEALVNQLTAGQPSLSDPKQTTTVAQPAARIVQPEPLDPVAVARAVVTPAALETPVAIALPSVAETAVAGPGPKRSLRPQIRPVRAILPATAPAGGATNASIVEAIATASPLDVDPDSLAPGTRLAQLGAFDSADIARAEWDRMNARFGDYLAGKSRVIQKATSGGRTFYRLRAVGFADLSDARRFCSALVAEKTDCIPVTTR